MRAQGYLQPNHIAEWQFDMENRRRRTVKHTEERFLYQLAEYGVIEDYDNLGFFKKLEES